ncbi:DUF2974 domain-containing protein [Pediococcus ethanolidurans]|uniref:DUF2974 domain-containing protein n=1 Tax=Pediococcus ethanolidurans TaxID=319653 RepID=UPI0021E8C367|nr:DUF2974 domain-containing protein [Pediococcus ethanolidurans]MCV3316068.1 DUF2974 domain-containing protein [Pediococcus ethanolidurans]MCV3328316.1 DUF2974 domain-containing protein [Pediococcus ethanolidurans]
MPDLLKYLDNYNRPLTANLNVADQMILTRLPFLPWQAIVSKSFSDEISLRDALKQLEQQLVHTSKYVLLPNDRILIQRLQTSFRYEKVKLSGFKIQTPDDLDKQCAAITVNIDSHTKIIVFRGADGTTLGWKSDLRIIYDADSTTWQDFAADYLKQVGILPSDTLQVIGFSKGGSMAIYAASHASSDIQKRVKQVVNFDGPQVASKPTQTEPVKSRFQTYLPQLPFFGIGSEFTNPPIIVNSTATGIWQHDLYSWQIHDATPVELGRASTTDNFLTHELRPWLRQQKHERAQLFIDTFWIILDKSEAVSINDLLKHWQQVTKAFRIQSNSWDPMARQMGQKALQSAFQIIVTFAHF